MMDFRQRLEQGNRKPAGKEAVGETEEAHTCPYFATEWGRSPACLELRLPQGMRKAIPYTHIAEIGYNPDNGIEISTAQRNIRITGRNLDKLFFYLVAYRVKYIQTNLGYDPGDDGLFVERIEIEALEP